MSFENSPSYPRAIKIHQTKSLSSKTFSVMIPLTPNQISIRIRQGNILILIYYSRRNQMRARWRNFTNLQPKSQPWKAFKWHLADFWLAKTKSHNTKSLDRILQHDHPAIVLTLKKEKMLSKRSLKPTSKSALQLIEI